MRKQWQCIACILACLLGVANVASAEDVLYKINTAWIDEAAFEASADRPQGYTWNVDAFGSLRDATEAVGAGSQTFEFTHASDAWMTLGAISLKGFASVAVTQNSKTLADFEVGDTASAEFGIAAAKPVVIAVTTAKDTDAYVMETRTVDVSPNPKTAVELTPATAGETASATGHVGYRTGAATYEVDVPAGQSGIYTFALQVTDSYTDDGGNAVAYGSRGYVAFTLETADGKAVAEFGDTNAQARRSVELAAGTYIATVDSTDHGAGAQNASFTIAVTAGKVNEGATLGDNSMEDTNAVLTLEGADGARSATLSGFVGLGDDQDWLLLENVESGRYTLTFDTEEGLDDDDTVHGAHVYLYRLYTPEDGVTRRKAVADTVFRGTATAIEGIVLDAAETYYIQILCPGGFASANDATYTLTLQETASFAGVSNADDNWKTPSTMTPATAVSDFVGGEDACDWYRLDLDSTKSWKARLDVTREKGVLFIEIGSRKAGTSLASPKTDVTYQLRDDSAFQQDLEFDAGRDYFIRFSSSNGNDTRYEAKFSLLFSLKVTLTPANAQWTVAENTYDSGESVILVAGTYQVTFSDIAGYVTPKAEDVVLDQDTVIEKAYATGYALVYNLTPATATWTVDGKTYASGATATVLGTHEVTFSAVEGYVTPDPEAVNVTEDTTKSKEYVPSFELSYTLTPADATWTVGGNTYASGETAALGRGFYDVTFSDETGYDTPVVQHLSLTENSTRTVAYAAEGTSQPYLVIDLTNWSWRYSTTAPDVSADTCRTTELWLRRIPAGTFTMGSPTDETGRVGDDGVETQHDVTLTEDYYIGVFECTQKQWTLVMGSNPSSEKGDCRSVGDVNYDMIRGTGSSAGAGWPTYGHTVDASSFMGVIQQKTGLVLDLPTEAQWEYACRKKADGTCCTTALNSGKNLTNTQKCPNLAEVGRYFYNANDGKGGYYADQTTVGSYEPSELGLYDMHGNLCEWCLDWYGTYGSGAATDSKGPETGTKRVLRGGSWGNDAKSCRAASRIGYAPANTYNPYFGFRVACQVPKHTLTYNLTPASAKWTVNGTTYASGESATLPDGTYTVAFSEAWGYVQPESKSVSNKADTVKTLAYVDAPYLMVDLSEGTAATSYPYTFSATAPDVSQDACRTTQLWLRKIPAGTFTMGSPSDEVGRVDGYDMAQHHVTLTGDYYIGVFACTQRQWELVMGTNPSYFSNADCYATRPVEGVSYDMIRGTGAQAGAGWPTCGHTVDESSFMGVIQQKTGLVLDLPTEAQWEYACRKKADGSCWTTALNSGNDLTNAYECANMAAVGRYWYNGGSGYSQSCSTEYGTAKVGSYQHSGLGLYDMHGNVFEWCLDWWGASTTSTAEETDPQGPTSGSSRVLRGGSWYYCANYCRAAGRCDSDPSYIWDFTGFRVACEPKKYTLTYTLTPASAKWTVNGTTYASGEKASLQAGTYTVSFSDVWGYAKPSAESVTLTSNTVKTASYTDAPYLMVDLSQGTSATSYPYTFSTTGPNVSQEACRTTQLWLRKIPAGTFTMGSPSDEVGREVGYDMAQHQVTLTEDYYIGVFECTQKQWELVMGAKPSYFSNADCYATRPVEQVSYDMIRGTGAQAGAGWPTYGHTVDESSFMGVIQQKTGLVLDLPTDAQWEYACRKKANGSCWTTALNSGKGLTDMYECANVAEVGRYWYNGGSGYSQSCSTTGGTAEVGSYQPSGLGLYDMHGNAFEWCLDWWGASMTSTAAETDPEGPTSGTDRVLRGGSWYTSASSCRAAYRGYDDPSSDWRSFGFRVACWHP